jgi:hypothetical protein
MVVHRGRPDVVIEQSPALVARRNAERHPVLVRDCFKLVLTYPSFDNLGVVTVYTTYLTSRHECSFPGVAWRLQ